MNTKKIRELDAKEVCTHPEHNPPMHQVFEEGVWEHTCPQCGKKVQFTVRRTR